MKRVVAIKVLEGYRLHLRFDDGVEGDLDLSDKVGKGVFSAWKDESFFRSVHIGSLGELVWSDQIDLCPDAMYLKITHQSPDQIFPLLKQEVAHA